MRFGALWLAAALSVAAPLAASAQQTGGDAAALAALEAGRQRFAAAQSGTYRYGYRKHCDCYREQPPLTVIPVVDGTLERVYHVHPDSPREVPARDGSLDLYWTIDDLFVKLENAYAVGAVVRAQYDERYGYPTSLYIDYDAALLGDETELVLEQFEPR